MKSELLYFNGVDTLPHKAKVELFRDLKLLHLVFEGGQIVPVPLNDLSIKSMNRFSLILEFKNNRNQQLEIIDPLLASTIKAMLPANSSNFRNRIWGSSNSYVGIILSILALLILFYFFALPFLAEKAVGLLPESADKKLGGNLYEEIENTEKFDTAATRILTDFVAAFYPEGKNKFIVKVVEKDELNAFALPDGHIIVYSGIIRQMEDESQLAGLLAHEMAHVEHRHSMRMVCKSLSGTILLSLLFHDVNGIVGTLINNAQGLQQLSYSRDYEKEADLSGFELMKKKKLDPDGMISLFEILENEERQELPGFFSSHPLTPDRISYLKKEIKENPYAVVRNQKLKELFETLSDFTHLENLEVNP
ncbi:hypothetical protein BH11BAC2_BH11BAC2_13830 [soil metagenome]